MSDFFTLNHSVKPPKGDCIQCSAVYVSQFSNTEISLVGLFASRLLLKLSNSIGQELLNTFFTDFGEEKVVQTISFHRFINK